MTAGVCLLLALCLGGLESSAAAAECHEALSESNTKRVFDALPKGTQPDGCVLDGVRTEGSRMEIRWAREGAELPPVLVVPRSCAEPSALLGKALSAIVPQPVHDACPAEIEILGTVVASDAVGGLAAAPDQGPMDGGLPSWHATRVEDKGMRPTGAAWDVYVPLIVAFVAVGAATAVFLALWGRRTTSSSLSRGRRVAFALVGSIGSVGLTCLLVELCFRAWNPAPRVAAVRADRVKEFWTGPGGVPLWSRHGRPPRCAARRPGVRSIGFFGSSIVYGAGLSRDEALAHQLEQRLEPSVPGGVCSDDFSEPGFAMEQQWAVATEAIPSTSPGVIVWEIWDPSKHFAVAADLAFDARYRTLDASGVPVLDGVPRAIADPLFHWSHAYQYAALALSQVRYPGRIDPQIDLVCRTMLPDLRRLAVEHGGRVIALLASRLDRPFAESIAQSSPYEMDPVLECVRNLGIPVVAVAELLADQKVEDVRLDPCCHLNARGHALLADRLEARVLRAMLPDAP